MTIHRNKLFSHIIQNESGCLSDEIKLISGQRRTDFRAKQQEAGWARHMRKPKEKKAARRPPKTTIRSNGIRTFYATESEGRKNYRELRQREKALVSHTVRYRRQYSSPTFRQADRNETYDKTNTHKPNKRYWKTGRKVHTSGTFGLNKQFLTLKL